MKLLIEIPEEAKQAFDCAESNDIKGSFYDHGGVIGNAIKNGIPIHDNATNGEVLCILFPNMHYSLSDKSSRVVTTIGVASSFDIGWWIAPYKEERNADK